MKSTTQGRPTRWSKKSPNLSILLLYWLLMVINVVPDPLVANSESTRRAGNLKAGASTAALQSPPLSQSPKDQPRISPVPGWSQTKLPFFLNAALELLVVGNKLAQAHYMTEYKIVLLGAGAVGKTCMVMQLAQVRTAHEESSSTSRNQNY